MNPKEQSILPRQAMSRKTRNRFLADQMRTRHGLGSSKLDPARTYGLYQPARAGNIIYPLLKGPSALWKSGGES